MELRGRVALVTGAGRRVGQALALALGDRGMRVVVHYHASADGALETVRLLRAMGTEAEAIRADLTTPAAPAELVRGAAAVWGGLDVLVNSASVMLRTPLGDVTPAVWDQILSLNLRAPFLAAQAAAPLLAERRGAIINIADLAAFETWPAYVPHGISKAGLVQMTRALARTLAPEVRVNAIAPGTVLHPEGWRADDAARLEATTPLRRTGSPNDVCVAMLYLLEADYVTGEVLLVDGGRHVRC